MNFKRDLVSFVFITICLLIINNSLTAQTDHTVGYWDGLLWKGKLAPRWSNMGEAHLRSNNFDLKCDYYEIKTGISYSITSHFTGLVGLGYYGTFETGAFFITPALQKEFRTWVELAYKHSPGRFNFNHRARLEQRFIGNVYKNRLRYQFAATFPINKRKMIPGSYYISLYDELFIPQHGVIVEKNRLYYGGGYKLSESFSFQLGIVNDTDYKPDYHSIKNYLQFLVIYDFTKLFKKNSPDN